MMDGDDLPPVPPLRVTKASKERVNATPEQLFADRSGEVTDRSLQEWLERLSREARAKLAHLVDDDGRVVYADVRVTLDDALLLEQDGRLYGNSYIILDRPGEGHRIPPTSILQLAPVGVPCENCGTVESEHAYEEGFGRVCPTDAAARTDDERFTYTPPGDLG